MKRCPFCVQTIPLDATVCKFCTREVNTDEEAEELVRAWMERIVEQMEKQKSDYNFLMRIVMGFVVAIVSIVIIIIWLGTRH